MIVPIYLPDFSTVVKALAMDRTLLARVHVSIDASPLYTLCALSSCRNLVLTLEGTLLNTKEFYLKQRCKQLQTRGP